VAEHNRRAVVVWAFTDGKAGHENQTRGLLAALAHRHPVDARWIHVPAYASVLSSLMTRRFLPGVGLPPPDLLVGAGHRTHLPLLAARRAHGGRTIVLMKPSLPRAWFDLCVIPEHDSVTGANVLSTRGALNPVEPGSKNARAGLILIGGPSRHHGWSEDEILSQVETIVPARAYRLGTTTSRRTQSATTALLRTLTLKNLTVVPVTETGPGWLSERLTSAAQVWVTEDSVSMVYESLTANAATGVLSVPAKRESRIARGIAALTRDGLVTRFADWQRGHNCATRRASMKQRASLPGSVKNGSAPDRGADDAGAGERWRGERHARLKTSRRPRPSLDCDLGRRAPGGAAEREGSMSPGQSVPSASRRCVISGRCASTGARAAGHSAFAPAPAGVDRLPCLEGLPSGRRPHLVTTVHGPYTPGVTRR
jgi:mitochondrial fission protein ELM1